MKYLLDPFLMLDLPGDPDSPAGDGSIALDTEEKDKVPEAIELKDFFNDESARTVLDTEILHKDEKTGKTERKKVRDLIDTGYKFGTGATRIMEQSSILDKVLKGGQPVDPGYVKVLQSLDATLKGLQGRMTPAEKAEAEDDLDTILADENLSPDDREKKLVQYVKGLKAEFKKELDQFKRTSSYERESAEIKEQVSVRKAELQKVDDQLFEQAKTNYPGFLDRDWERIILQRKMAGIEALNAADKEMKVRGIYDRISLAQLQEIYDAYEREMVPSFDALAQEYIADEESRAKAKIEGRKPGGSAGTSAPSAAKTPQPPKGNLQDQDVVNFLNSAFNRRQG